MVDQIAEIVFWLSVAGVIYPYFCYPLLLAAIGKLAGRSDETPNDGALPTVTMIIPAANEAARIAAKVANTAALDYPHDRLQILFVSDGSTDETVSIIRRTATAQMTLIERPTRGGKAAALNAALARSANDIIVFSDASIALEPSALRAIVRRFQDPLIGCISGEDRIAESGGEGLYGRYELLLRRLESRVHSIVGASGSFYAQRRALCAPFTEGMAPDFLSVLRTVEQGYRAVSEPRAVGLMTSVKDVRHEFERKVRTLIRGMAALFGYLHLLNPLRHGVFAFVLFSHKVMRWTAPVFLLLALLAPLALLNHPIYAVAFLLQAAFYACAATAYAEWGSVHRTVIGRVALYFSTVNGAILTAWCQYGRGVRQEVWTPSRR